MSSGLAPARYDLILVGAGAAGLTLAHQWATSVLREGRLLLIERDLAAVERRAWSWWAWHPTPFEPWVYRTWQVLRVAGAEGVQELPLETYRYQTLRGRELVQQVRQVLADCPRSELVEGEVERVVDGPEVAEVWVGGRCHTASWVFDSRPESAQVQAAGAERMLHQRFHGWVVQAERAVFDTRAAMLFDFRVPQEGDFRFVYLLPFSPELALVELVTLAPCEPERLLRGYLEQVLGGVGYRVAGQEYGATLLTAAPFARREGSRVLRVGIPGGRIKPSSGYGFIRALEDAEAVVRSLQAYGHPFARLPRTPWHFRLMDAVMLEAMAAEPGRMAAVYERMFARNPVERVLRLLDERASVRDVVGMIWSMPWGLFLRAWLRHEVRRLGAGARADRPRLR